MVTPICPHVLTNRSVIVSNRSHPDQPSQGEQQLSMSVDGQNSYNCKPTTLSPFNMPTRSSVAPAERPDICGYFGCQAPLERYGHMIRIREALLPDHIAQPNAALSREKSVQQIVESFARMPGHRWSRFVRQLQSATRQEE